MKHVIAVLAVGPALLLPSAGVVFAANPHPYTTSGTGQPGSNNGISCGGPNATSAPAGGANGKVSPFNTVDPTRAPRYAGNPLNPTYQGPGGAMEGNPLHSVSQYDVACFQATQHP